ncbi:MAG: hypothetical protein WCD18_18820 [Thermosynechococcaceae cyanobacterium]
MARSLNGLYQVFLWLWGVLGAIAVYILGCIKFFLVMEGIGGDRAECL